MQEKAILFTFDGNPGNYDLWIKASDGENTTKSTITVIVELNQRTSIPIKQSPATGSGDHDEIVTLQWQEASPLDPDGNFDHYEVYLTQDEGNWPIEPYNCGKKLIEGDTFCDVSVELGLKEYFWNVLACDNFSCSHEPNKSP